MYRFWNQCVLDDPEAFVDLKPYTGHTLGLVIRPCYQQTFKILPSGQLESTPLEPAEASTCIQGRIRDFNALLLGDKSALDISGDIHLAVVVEHVWLKLDHSMGAWLARLLGETTSHLLTPVLEKTKAVAQSLSQACVHDLQDYLRYESDMIPNTAAMNAFLQEVDRVAQDADRLDIRLSLLEQRLSLDESL